MTTLLPTIAARLGAAAFMIARCALPLASAIALSTNAFGAAAHCSDQDTDHEWVISFNPSRDQGAPTFLRVAADDSALFLARNLAPPQRGNVYMDGDCHPGVREHSVAWSRPARSSNAALTVLSME